MSEAATVGGGTGLRLRIAFIAVVLLAIALAQYKGLGSLYYMTVSAVRDWNTFKDDIFFGGSLYLEGSIYNDLVRISGIPVERDDVGLTIHIILSTIAVLCAFAIFRRHLGIAEPDCALAAVLISCFLANELILTSRPEVISSTSHNPAGTGQALSFLVLLLLLERRMLLAAISMTVVLAITPRANFILPPIAILYIVLNPTISIRTLWVMVIPFGYLAWKALAGGGGELTFEDRLLLCEALIQRDGDGEIAIHLQPWQAWLLLVGALVAFPWLLRQIDSPDARALGWAVWAGTIAATIFGALYAGFLYRYVPDPRLLLLSIPRAMRTFTFLAAAMATAVIFRSAALVWYEKVAACLAIVVLKATTLGIAAAGALLGGGIGLPRVLRSKLGWRLERWPVVRTVGSWPLAMTLSLAVSAFFLVRLPVSYGGLDHISSNDYREIGIWSLRVSADPATWAAWRAMADVPGDFELFAVYRPKDPRYGQVNTHVVANVLGRKRNFSNEPGLALLDAERWREALARQSVGNAILTHLAAGKPVTDERVQELLARKFDQPVSLGKSLPAFLAERNARVLAPPELARLFTMARERRAVGNHVLLAF